MAKTKHSTDKRGRGWVRARQGLLRRLVWAEPAVARRPCKQGGACRSFGEGFTLVEVLVAMGIMAMMMISIVQLFVMATYVNKSVEERTRLANIAQMHTEELRRLYMTWPDDVTFPKAISRFFPADSTYDPHNFTPAGFKSQWDGGHATIYVAKTVNDIRQYLPYTKGDTLPAPLDDLLQPGSGLEALVAWWVDDTLYPGQALEIRIDVRSGYVLTGTPLLKTISISYTAVFPSRDFYKLPEEL
jgi:type II secretory pathway pseudopilin PulG